MASDNLKVLMINKYHFVKGGSERYMFDLQELLEKNGHEVIPFGMADEKNIPSDYNKYFVDAIDYDFKSKVDKILSVPKVFGRMTYSFHAKERLEALLKNTKVDIAHLHMIDHQLSPSILHVLKKYNIPVVQTVHQYKLVCPNYRLYVPQKAESCERCLAGNYFNAVIQRCHKGSLFASAMVAVETAIHKAMQIQENNIDYFIVPSGFMGEKLAQGGIPEDKIKPIYHFIESENYPKSFEESDYFVCYGRLSEEKGLFTLLKAIKNLPSAKLKMIGDGPEREKLEDFAKENNINVEFTGKKLGDELKQLVSKSKFVVLPSEWYENSPMVIYESFAMGKPIVGAKAGGITELIRHEVDGLLFEMRNEKQLRQAIETMLNDHELVKKYGQAGYERVIGEFDPVTHYDKVMELYDNLLQKTSSEPRSQKMKVVEEMSQE